MTARRCENLSSSLAFFMFDLLLFAFFSFVQFEKRNFVSLSCNQTIYYKKKQTMPLAIECVAITTLIFKLVRNMLFSSCFRAIADLVFHWCYIIIRYFPWLGSSNIITAFFSSGLSSKFGKWSRRGCRVFYSNDGFTECHCDHMTNYAVLMRVKEQVRYNFIACVFFFRSGNYKFK